MHEDAHCSNTYCKEKLEKPEHLHYVYYNMFREFPGIGLHVVNKNAKQETWVVTRKLQGKINFFSLFEIINL